MKDMTAAEYQNLAARTMADTSFNDKSLAVVALGLAGESGEFADHVKKYMGQGHKLDVDKLRDELGDVLFYVAFACEVLGLDMDNVMGANICKLKKRYPSGFTTAASIARADVDPRQLTVEGT